MQRTYTYHGDRFTAPDLKGQTCHAVTRPDGKCIRGRNGNMLVFFPVTGGKVVVGARLLRKLSGTLVQNLEKQAVQKKCLRMPDNPPGNRRKS